MTVAQAWFRTAQENESRTTLLDSAHSVVLAGGAHVDLCGMSIDRSGFIEHRMLCSPPIKRIGSHLFMSDGVSNAGTRAYKHACGQRRPLPEAHTRSRGP